MKLSHHQMTWKIYIDLTSEIFLSGMQPVKMCGHDEVFVLSLKI